MSKEDDFVATSAIAKKVKQQVEHKAVMPLQEFCNAMSMRPNPAGGDRQVWANGHAL